MQTLFTGKFVICSVKFDACVPLLCNILVTPFYGSVPSTTAHRLVAPCRTKAFSFSKFMLIHPFFNPFTIVCIHKYKQNYIPDNHPSSTHPNNVLGFPISVLFYEIYNFVSVEPLLVIVVYRQIVHEHKISTLKRNFVFGIFGRKFLLVFLWYLFRSALNIVNNILYRYFS